MFLTWNIRLSYLLISLVWFDISSQTKLIGSYLHDTQPWEEAAVAYGSSIARPSHAPGASLGDRRENEIPLSSDQTEVAESNLRSPEILMEDLFDGPPIDWPDSLDSNDFPDYHLTTAWWDTMRQQQPSSDFEQGVERHLSKDEPNSLASRASGTVASSTHSSEYSSLENELAATPHSHLASYNPELSRTDPGVLRSYPADSVVHDGLMGATDLSSSSKSHDSLFDTDSSSSPEFLYYSTLQSDRKRLKETATSSRNPEPVTLRRRPLSFSGLAQRTPEHPAETSSPQSMFTFPARIGDSRQYSHASSQSTPSSESVRSGAPLYNHRPLHKGQGAHSGRFDRIGPRASYNPISSLGQHAYDDGMSSTPLKRKKHPDDIILPSIQLDRSVFQSQGHQLNQISNPSVYDHDLNVYLEEIHSEKSTNEDLVTITRRLDAFVRDYSSVEEHQVMRDLPSFLGFIYQDVKDRQLTKIFTTLVKDDKKYETDDKKTLNEMFLHWYYSNWKSWFRPDWLQRRSTISEAQRVIIQGEIIHLNGIKEMKILQLEEKIEAYFDICSIKLSTAVWSWVSRRMKGLGNITPQIFVRMMKKTTVMFLYKVQMATKLQTKGSDIGEIKKTLPIQLELIQHFWNYLAYAYPEPNKEYEKKLSMTPYEILLKDERITKKMLELFQLKNEILYSLPMFLSEEMFHIFSTDEVFNQANMGGRSFVAFNGLSQDSEIWKGFQTFFQDCAVADWHGKTRVN